MPDPQLISTNLANHDSGNDVLMNLLNTLFMIFMKATAASACTSCHG